MLLDTHVWICISPRPVISKVRRLRRYPDVEVIW